jgi:hypothetical protein
MAAFAAGMQNYELLGDGLKDDRLKDIRLLDSKTKDLPPRNDGLKRPDLVFRFTSLISISPKVILQDDRGTDLVDQRLLPAVLFFHSALRDNLRRHLRGEPLVDQRYPY